MNAARFIDWTARPFHTTAQVQFEPRDIWVGVFWKLHRWKSERTGWDHAHGDWTGAPWSLHLYICIVPMLPLHVYVMRTLRP